MKFRFTWCRTCGTSGKFGFGCTTEPEERREKTKSNGSTRDFHCSKTKTSKKPDLGSQRVCLAGSLHCPAGWSSGASGRSRMENNVRLYCAPITESLGSHLQTGLGGLTLWKQDRNNEIISVQKAWVGSYGVKHQTAGATVDPQWGYESIHQKDCNQEGFSPRQ